MGSAELTVLPVQVLSVLVQVIPKCNGFPP